MLFLPKTAASHEDLFVERYDRLLSWSLQLTDRDRSQAEDLLHDAFILFTLNQPDLSSIRNLDAYLHAMLRNLHISQMRRATRSRFQQLSILDYDSAEIGLWAVDPRDQIQAQDQLRRVCHYACARKETAKLGSILILRFFHGYYPSEIVQMLRTTRNSADRGLLMARGEAKASLDDPGSLAFIVKGQAPEVLRADFARTTEGFLSELRQTIFCSRQGECLSRDQLKRLYQSRKAAPLSCEHLAHIISFPPCLDEVNWLLGLPPLSDRYPTDTMNKDSSTKGGPPSGPTRGAPSGSSPRGSLAKWKREARATFEHKPKELCIAVNGYIQGSQRISSELMEQSFIVDMPERIGFVEVFSEQGFRLLLLNIDEPPPVGPGEHSMRVSLSDQRALELSLRFSNPWPTVYVTYSDPALAAESGLKSLESGGERFEEGQPPTSNVQRRESSPTVLEGEDNQLLRFFAAARSRCLGLARRGKDFGLSTLDSRLLRRPGTVTAILAALLIAVALCTYLRRGPVAPVSAADLLARSAATKDAIGARPDRVVHRTIDLEERSGEGGELIRKQKIEIWENGEKDITARRLYDEKNQLIAGDWRRADGVQTLYHHGAGPQLQLTPEKRGVGAALSFEDVWQLSASAKEFAALVGTSENARVEERPSLYVITYVGEAGGNNLHLVKATLMLNRADLHPIEQILLIKQGNETREFHFTETAFERWSPSAVNPATFEPEPELVSSTRLETRNSKLETASTAPDPQPLAPFVAAADLEVEVLRLLNSAGADLGEQISVSRPTEGELRVQGLVETEQRKAEILHALSVVASNPAVKIDVSTFTEALARERQARAVESEAPLNAQRVETSSDIFPAYADLHSRFSDEEARRYATAMVNRSHEAMRRVWALKRLLQQFSAEDLRTLSPEARAKWLALIRSHAAAFGRETAQLHQQLAPMFFPGGANEEGSAPGAIANDAELLRAVERLIAVASTNDQVVTAAFTISAESTTVSAIKTPQFFRSLKSAERLAQEIGQYHLR